MRKPTEPGDDVSMLYSKVEGSRIGELLKQWQRPILNVQVFAVHHWHQHELSVGLVFVRDKSTLDALMAECQRHLISGEGLGGVSVDIAGELVQDQDRGEHLFSIVPL